MPPHLRGARLARALATAASSGRPISLPRVTAGVQRATQPSVDAPGISPILASLLRQAVSDRSPSLAALAEQLSARAGAVLPFELPYESTPARGRRVDLDLTTPVSGVGILAVVGRDIATSLTFRIGIDGDPERSTFVALEGFQRDGSSHGSLVSEDLNSSAAVAISSGPLARSITSVVSALPPSPLLLFTVSELSPTEPVRTLPVSPYPAPVETRVRYPAWAGQTLDDGGWRWVEGVVVGYRDYAGNAAQTGTYDTLAHMLIYPPPPPLVISAGAPVLDVDSGAVVGVLTGRKVAPTVAVAARTEAGWAVPAGRLFEAFQLPGMAGKR